MIAEQSSRRSGAPRFAGLLWGLSVAILGCSKPEVQAIRSLSPVVQTHLARLDALLAAEDTALEQALQSADDKPQREVLGLLQLISGMRDPVRRTALEDLGRLGARAVPILEAALIAPESADSVRVAAVEGLWVAGNGSTEESELPPGASPADLAPRLAAIEALCRVVKDSRLATVRARAAWYLGRLGLDRAVPDLCLRLKYEIDSETVIWLTWSLARFQNFAGLGALDVIAANSEDSQAESAAGMANQLAQEQGLDSGGLLGWTWQHGDPEGKLPQAPLSPRLERELWRRIAVFDQYQLRGVDDSRFIFERLDARAAPYLAEALSDESRYVRYHAAQCLGRMGRRGGQGAAALIEALRRPDTAAVAAEALGAIGHPEARLELEALLDPKHPLELRLAAARGLGHLGLAESQPKVRASFEASKNQPELHVALGEALLYLRDESGAVEPLLAAWGDPAFEQRPIEAALGYALQKRAEADDETGPVATAWKAWNAAAALPDAERIPARKQVFPR